MSLGLTRSDSNILRSQKQYPLYTIIIISQGNGTYHADFGSFKIDGPAILFSTPLQTLKIEGNIGGITMLQFHGDFYCIEYHKREVACNGVLFNNIYSKPIINLKQDKFAFFDRLMSDLEAELTLKEPSDAVLTAYLQLLLAKATAIMNQVVNSTLPRERDEIMEAFKLLIDENFLSMRKPAQYADRLHITPDTLSKRCKQYFRKTPTALIQERIALEAKKKLHLTRKSIKEIAFSLRFKDEHYFSRFFKKVTKVTPVAFRKKTGISIVANSSSLNTD